MTFVVLDGVDGCGKSTQARLLVERLRAAGRSVRHLREPGTTAVGESLRQLLLETEVDLDARSEVLLFAAARRQLAREEIAPALAAGEVVVCERFDPSTFAYQAVAGGLPEDEVLDLLTRWGSPVVPDRVLVLLVEADQAGARRRDQAEDRIEAKGLAFQRRVAEGYRRYAATQPHAVEVDGSRTVDEVADAVWNEVQRVL